EQKNTPAIDVRDVMEKLRKRLEHSRDEVIEHILTMRSELIEGRTLVSDADVSVLDVATVAKIVELRLTVAGLLEDAVAIVQSASLTDEQLLTDSVKNQMVEAFSAGIRAAFAMKYLMNRSEFYLRRGRLRAVAANFFL